MLQNVSDDRANVTILGEFVVSSILTHIRALWLSH
jgi:hypothetical protein